MNKISNFFHTVFVKAVWQTFCVQWVWKTFFVAWIYQAFWRELIVKKLQFDKWKGWVYLLPVLVLIAIFTVWPIINTVSMAFQNGYSALMAKRGISRGIATAQMLNTRGRQAASTSINPCSIRRRL